MPRYFFDARDAGNVMRDEVGIELPDDKAARKHAATLLPDIARRGLPDGEDHSFGCDARNEGGSVVYRASLKYRGERISCKD
jgi:hypothetical protein